MDHWITLEDLADFMDSATLPLETSELAISAAEATVRSYLNQNVTYVEEDIEIHDGRNQWKIRLFERPVREVILVEVDGVELDPTAWVVNGFVLKRIDGVAFPYGIDNVAITYDHGWDFFTEEDSSGDVDDLELPVPADLRYVTLSIAARRLDLTGAEAGATQGGITGEQIGQYSYTVDAGVAATLGVGTQGLQPDEEMTLDAYRVPAIQR
jgi:hypothetical protein